MSVNLVIKGLVVFVVSTLIYQFCLPHYQLYQKNGQDALISNIIQTSTTSWKGIWHALKEGNLKEFQVVSFTVDIFLNRIYFVVLAIGLCIAYYLIRLITLQKPEITPIKLGSVDKYQLHKKIKTKEQLQKLSKNPKFIDLYENKYENKNKSISKEIQDTQKLLAEKQSQLYD